MGLEPHRDFTVYVYRKFYFPSKNLFAPFTNKAYRFV